MAVFEGFFDLLSWIEDQGIEALPCDVCVFNSVSNLRRALEFLSAHKEIHLYLDNDRAGAYAAAQIECFCVNEDTRVVSMSHLFDGHKDYNEMLVATTSTHKSHSYGKFITERRSEQTEQDQLESPEEKYEISKETIMKNPTVATQLAYGQMTVMDRLKVDPQVKQQAYRELCHQEKDGTYVEQKRPEVRTICRCTSSD